MYPFKKILFLLFIFCINKLVIAAPYIEVSHKSGFYKDQIDVSITADNSFIKIFYTSMKLDTGGFTPTENNLEWQGKYFDDYKIKISVDSKANESNGSNGSNGGIETNGTTWSGKPAGFNGNNRTNGVFSHWEIKTGNNTVQVEIIANPTIEITPVDGMVLSAIYK